MSQPYTHTRTQTGASRVVCTSKLDAKPQPTLERACSSLQASYTQAHTTPGYQNGSRKHGAHCMCVYVWVCVFRVWCKVQEFNGKQKLQQHPAPPDNLRSAVLVAMP